MGIIASELHFGGQQGGDWSIGGDPRCEGTATIESPWADGGAHIRGVGRPPVRGRGYPWGRGKGARVEAAAVAATAQPATNRGRPLLGRPQYHLPPHVVTQLPPLSSNLELRNLENNFLQNGKIGVCPIFQEVCSDHSSSSSLTASSEENSGNEMGVHGDVSHEADGHGDILERVILGERNIVEDP